MLKINDSVKNLAFKFYHRHRHEYTYNKIIYLREINISAFVCRQKNYINL